MAERYLRQSALADLALEAERARAGGDHRTTLAERPPRAQIALRGDITDTAFGRAVDGALGVTPPPAANTVATGEAASILWMGPDEWLAVTGVARGAEALAALERSFASLHALASDVSCSRTVIALAGEDARAILAKGCSLDLHPRVFAAGQCAQSHLARCHVLLHQLDDVPTFDLYVHRSFARYAWAWLRDAAREFDVAVVQG